MQMDWSYDYVQNICEEDRNTVGSDPDANSPTFKKLDDNNEEFGMRELLCAIAAAYDKINVAHGKIWMAFGSLPFCPYISFSSYVLVCVMLILTIVNLYSTFAILN